MAIDHQEIPPGNLLKRWTKDATCPDANSIAVTSIQTIGNGADRLRKHLLLDKVLELASSDREISDETFNNAIAALNFQSDISNKDKSKHEQRSSNGAALTYTNIAGTIPTSCPVQPYMGGRPPNTGLKLFLASIKKEAKRKTIEEINIESKTSSYEENLQNGKTRKIEDIMGF